MHGVCHWWTGQSHHELEAFQTCHVSIQNHLPRNRLVCWYQASCSRGRMPSPCQCDLGYGALGRNKRRVQVCHNSSRSKDLAKHQNIHLSRTCEREQAKQTHRKEFQSKHDDRRTSWSNGRINRGTHGEEDEIYPLTIIEIAEAQKKDRNLKIYYKRNAKTPEKGMSFQLIEDKKVYLLFQIPRKLGISLQASFLLTNPIKVSSVDSWEVLMRFLLFSGLNKIVVEVAKNWTT